MSRELIDDADRSVDGSSSPVVAAPTRVAHRHRKSTVADVAALAGVDRSVVSRVINDDPRLNVRDSTRRRVREAVAALGYRPNVVARSLRTARAGAYALVVPDFHNPGWAPVIVGAEQTAAAHRSILATSSYVTGHFEVDRYVDLLAPGRVDGLLLTDVRVSEHVRERLAELDIPWLNLNQRDETSPRRFVVLDDERAACFATRHLIELGHERIAHIAGPACRDSSRRRCDGYLAALEHASVVTAPDGDVGGRRALVVETIDGSNAEGERAMHALLTAVDGPPTAVVTFNISVAIGALRALHAAGVAVPGEVSVIAIHDLAVAAYLAPPLTAVRMPLGELGRIGLERLISAPPDAEIAETIEAPIELVVRASTAPLSRRRLRPFRR